MFVVIKPPPVGLAKESNLPPEEDLLEIVDLDEKPDVEVYRHVTVIYELFSVQHPKKGKKMFGLNEMQE